MIKNCRSNMTKEIFGDLVWGGTLVLVQVISKVILRLVLRR